MATAHNIDELLALLADNTENAISPADVQDVVASKGVFGCARAANVSASITTVSTFYGKASNLWDTAGPLGGGVAFDSNTEELVLPQAGVYWFTCSFSWRHYEGTFRRTEFAIAVNGTVSTIRTAANSKGSLAVEAVAAGWLSGLVTVPAANARATIWIRETTPSADPRVEILKFNRALLTAVRVR